MGPIRLSASVGQPHPVAIGGVEFGEQFLDGSPLAGNGQRGGGVDGEPWHEHERALVRQRVRQRQFVVVGRDLTSTVSCT